MGDGRWERGEGEGREEGGGRDLYFVKFIFYSNSYLQVYRFTSLCVEQYHLVFVVFQC